jgi:hypothetical protein
MIAAVYARKSTVASVQIVPVNNCEPQQFSYRIRERGIPGTRSHLINTAAGMRQQARCMLVREVAGMRRNRKGHPARMAPVAIRLGAEEPLVAATALIRIFPPERLHTVFCRCCAVSISCRFWVSADEDPVSPGT